VTTSCREQVLAAFAARLAAITAVPGLTVERERADPVATDALPFLGVYDDGAAEPPDFSGERDYTLTVTVEGYRAGATALAARQNADELGGLVAKALFGDVTLGGLARDLRPSPDPSPPRTPWDFPSHVGSFVASYEVDYATSETDPFVFA
jgi:hypothetical protein